MILYIENLKKSTQKLLELISEFASVAGYKSDIQKLVILLYTSNEQFENEIKKAVPFTIPSKRILKNPTSNHIQKLTQNGAMV